MLLKPTWLLLFTACGSLSAGTIFYFFSRPGMRLFQWLHLHQHNIAHPYKIAAVFSGYSGDLAWITALYLFVIVLDISKLSDKIGKLLLVTLPFLTETGQYFLIVPGTFDWYDLLLYTVVFIVFTFSFPKHFYSMKKCKHHLFPVAISVLFFLMVLACATPGQSYRAPKPLPCVTHKGLNYSPVLTRINLSGSYTMKDLNGAQRYAYDYFMDELRRLNPGKYQLADGVTPNLTIDVVINTDTYQHYGATLNMYVYDGQVYNSWDTNYFTVDKLYDDICAKVNAYVSYGWCTNCPSPCNP